MILKKCRKCCLDLPLTRFQRSNVPKLNGDVIYSSSCIKCRKIAASKGRTRVNKPRVKIVDREDVLIDNIRIYSLIRKIDLNKLKINNIDTFRLVSLYIDVYAQGGTHLSPHTSVQGSYFIQVTTQRYVVDKVQNKAEGK